MQGVNTPKKAPVKWTNDPN